MRVIVLMGGPASEYAVSISSGRQVVSALTAAGHTVFPVLMDQHNRFHSIPASTILSLEPSLQPDQTMTAALTTTDQPSASLEGVGINADVVFIAMHGAVGEDGKIQSLLELVGKPYTGSGVLASALSMNKLQFRRLMRSLDILIPPFLTLRDQTDEQARQETQRVLGEPPFIVKPNDQGSSYGVSLVHEWSELDAAIREARRFSETVLIDSFIAGREFTVGVLALPETTTLPVIEIIPDGSFFDYNAKYLSKKTQEICPAEIPKELANRLQSIAVDVFTAVEARHFARVDFLVDESGRPFVLEVNTIPGLTPASLLPKAAEAAGIPFETLMDKITRAAATQQTARA